MVTGAYNESGLYSSPESLPKQNLLKLCLHISQAYCQFLEDQLEVAKQKVSELEIRAECHQVTAGPSQSTAGGAGQLTEGGTPVQR